MPKSYDICVEELLEKINIGKKDGLFNMKILLDILGHPENNFITIHVAGTNGKGSVCNMLSYIIKESQKKVGLFTSPHLVKINERIQVDNISISDENFLDSYNDVMDAIDIMVSKGYNHPTFFEIIFGMALVYFKKQKVDICIIETGIGGRLDSTNAIEKTWLSIITKLGFDHSDVLGDTIEKIAYEKAGIIKKNSKVVFFNAIDKIEKIILDKAEKENTKVFMCFPYEYKINKVINKTIDFSIDNKYYKYSNLILNSFAKYQIENVAVVLTSIEALKEIFEIKEEHIRKGLENFLIFGRMEIIGKKIIVDGAHNEDGINAFVETINDYFLEDNIELLFTCMKDKEHEKLIKGLSRLKNISKIIVTKVNNSRNEDEVKIAQEFKANGFENTEIITDYTKYVKDFVNNNEQKYLAVVGSLYLVGEIKKLVLEENKND